MLRNAILDNLINSGFWVSSDIYQQVLALMGEGE
ncbi:MAG: DUF3368 domain-containing protein [Okeania sp. SIO3I5]|nr:DUF3368 domain-containing protein [Okeania sp. SIO3I5]NEQ38712.1 DUF3368 domain-containing protein [Okeania sp. SIO3I5]